MRHRKHNHLLGVKTCDRISLLANLSCSLIENGRIKTTLAKARALRPTIEKVITLAKKTSPLPMPLKKFITGFAIARLHNKKAVKKLFDELVEQFANRNGGYTRIYKLAMPRLGDAADMAIIEFVEDAPKKKAKKKKAPSKKTKKIPDSESDQPVEQEAQSDAEGAKDSSVEPVSESESKDVDSEVETQSDASDENAESKEEEPSAEGATEDSADEPVSESESKDDDSEVETQSDASDENAESGEEEPDAEGATEDSADDFRFRVGIQR